jgi:hypothetical protein
MMFEVAENLRLKKEIENLKKDFGYEREYWKNTVKKLEELIEKELPHIDITTLKPKKNTND